ncbi:membrane protein insertase YidC [Saccharospirillum salsuginis]|uniref:Membrane protein insertase YidC n=1 Tax=Saccharospirillum salsuginis TaxID=418750 RepID=A0A918N8S2_9GAMM|nr:membrane protein insertase YidC [Saccharospirillum salsuginis]GGX48141.1 membrane protein insertase YidC [Saccharospirillum salsuginis]
MDVRRIVLIAGLAVVSYLLVLQWSQDYAEAPPEQPTSSLSSEAGVDVPTSEAPQSTASSSDVPAAAPADTGNRTETPATQGGADGDQIEVSTDALNLRINLNGGDITHASLPKYPFRVDTPEIPFTLLESGQRTYTAMSGLVGPDGIDTETRARYQAEQNRYELDESQEQLEVTLTHTTDAGLIVDKVITVTRGSYLIDVRYDIRNNTDASITANMFGQLKRDGSDDPSAGGAIGMASYLGAALTTPDDRYKKVSFGDMEDETFRVEQQGGWVAILQHYFLSAWVPAEEQRHNYYARQLPNSYYYAGFQSPSITVAPGETASTGSQLYVGPKDQDRLAEISPHLELTVDYGWLWWAAQPLFKLLQFMHSLTGNWGWAIVLMTLTVKTVLYPLTASSYRSMAKMRKFAPKMTQLREQYGDDRQRLGQEMMKLYKKEKLNPMGGCLPILIQMPVFIALYWVLMESVELRQSPFIFWIQDLSIKDPFFVLPLLMGGSMFLQMQMQQQPNMDPMQARMMKMMPLVFTFMFLWFPAGLTLYWFVNNVSTIVQQWIVNRQFEKAEQQKEKA